MARSRKPRGYAEDPDPLVVVGVDAEWVAESAGRNLILSYQFTPLNDDINEISKLIIYPKAGKRISLEQGLSRALMKAQRENVIKKAPRRIVLTGHFTRADLTTFDNFHEYKRKLGAVRKSYTTIEIPLLLRLASSEGRARCNATVVDSMLLSASGTSLETIGKLLNVPKVELPDGYSKDRMNLFLKDHPKEFETYALTDAEISARWVARTYRLLREKLGINRKVITLGGAAVEVVRKEAKLNGIDLNAFLGQEKPKQPRPHLASLFAIAAQSYHGGYNIATALGFSPEERELYDLDIKSAYTTALAFIQVPDWTSARHCVELKQLAVIEEAMTAALVEFRFPDGTLYPCLPVRAKNGRGLIYPMEGSSWCTGPEMVLALAAGAMITVKDGYRVDWQSGSIRLFENITRLVGKIRAEAKAQQPPDDVLDKTIKEVGNSMYGKIAQSVASTRIIKDDIERRRIFNTQLDETGQLGPSAITNPMMAAYCTGLVRALLIEASMRLPAGTWVGTCTTDGLLSTCGLNNIDQSGEIAIAFKAARERITPGDSTIWELKHVIPRALVTKTRGTYTVADDVWNGSAVLAKAGYMTPEGLRMSSPIIQCQAWVKLYRERDYETTMESKSLTPLREQHIFEVDMQAVVRDIRWNADYDMKRKLVNVRDVDGLITADTEPWRSIDEFEQARDRLDDWRRSQRRVLKTAQDYDDMEEWSMARTNRSKIGTRSHNALSPAAAAVLKVLAHRTTPLSEWFKTETDSQKAAFMSALTGVKITKTTVKNARRRGAGPGALVGCLTTLNKEDESFLLKWLRFNTIAETSDIVWMLVAPGSAAAEALEDLRDYISDCKFRLSEAA
jgi:hypothetical protein